MIRSGERRTQTLQITKLHRCQPQGLPQTKLQFYIGSARRLIRRFTSFPAGGNQRELARAKNLKKQQEQAKKKGGESGVALKERKERDAAMMREKQKKAAEKKEADAATKK